jgi:hypothetical protein
LARDSEELTYMSVDELKSELQTCRQYLDKLIVVDQETMQQSTRLRLCYYMIVQELSERDDDEDVIDELLRPLRFVDEGSPTIASSASRVEKSPTMAIGEKVEESSLPAVSATVPRHAAVTASEISQAHVHPMPSAAATTSVAMSSAPIKKSVSNNKARRSDRSEIDGAVSKASAARPPARSRSNSNSSSSNSNSRPSRERKPLVPPSASADASSTFCFSTVGVFGKNKMKKEAAKDMRLRDRERAKEKEALQAKELLPEEEEEPVVKESEKSGREKASVGRVSESRSKDRDRQKEKEKEKEKERKRDTEGRDSVRRKKSVSEKSTASTSDTEKAKEKEKKRASSIPPKRGAPATITKQTSSGKEMEKGKQQQKVPEPVATVAAVVPPTALDERDHYGESSIPSVADLCVPLVQTEPAAVDHQLLPEDGEAINSVHAIETTAPDSRVTVEEESLPESASNVSIGAVTGGGDSLVDATESEEEVPALTSEDDSAQIASESETEVVKVVEVVENEVDAAEEGANPIDVVEVEADNDTKSEVARSKLLLEAAVDAVGATEKALEVAVEEVVVAGPNEEEPKKKEVVEAEAAAGAAAVEADAKKGEDSERVEEVEVVHTLPEDVLLEMERLKALVARRPESPNEAKASPSPSSVTVTAPLPLRRSKAAGADVLDFTAHISHWMQLFPAADASRSNVQAVAELFVCYLQAWSALTEGMFFEKSADDVHSKRYVRVMGNRSEVHSIVRKAVQLLEKQGWEEQPGKNNHCYNLLWTWSRPKIDYNLLFKYQKVNHFPNSRNITRKDLLKKQLARYAILGGKVGEIFNSVYPETYILPGEYVGFCDAFTKWAEQGKEANTWIMKPVGLSRGRGIFVFNDISDVSYGDSVIVQKYLHRPLLWKGFKFDLRLYLLVTSFAPLEAWLYDEGFARLASRPFSMDMGQVSDRFMHLTNSSIQKFSNECPIESEDPLIQGDSKLRLSWVFAKLAEQGHDIPQLWSAIIDLLLRALFAAQEGIGHCENAFELFGADILIDEDGRPWLLEINASPSLAIANPLDEDVKVHMIRDTLALVDPVPFDRRYLTVHLENWIKASGRTPSVSAYKDDPMQLGLNLNEALNTIFCEGLPRRYGEMPVNCGGYERIAPSPKYARLEQLKRKPLQPVSAQVKAKVHSR